MCIPNRTIAHTGDFAPRSACDRHHCRLGLRCDRSKRFDSYFITYIPASRRHSLCAAGRGGGGQLLLLIDSVGELGRAALPADRCPGETGRMTARTRATLTVSRGCVAHLLKMFRAKIFQSGQTHRAPVSFKGSKCEVGRRKRRDNDQKRKT